MERRVTLDERGRLLIPAEIRRKLPSNTLILRWLGDRLELIPLEDPRKLVGRYPLKGSWEEIEERQRW